MSNIHDRLHIEHNDRELYTKKISDFDEIFKKKNNKELFLFAMAYGFKNKMRVPFKRRDGFFLEKDLKPDDVSLLNAVALYETNSVDTLLDKGKIYQIAEEYAHAGIRLLVDRIDAIEFVSFWKHFEKELFEAHGSLDLTDGES